MNKSGDKLNDFIVSNPRESLFILGVVLCLIWQTPVAIVALIIFLFYSRIIQKSPTLLLICGISVLCMAYVALGHKLFIDLVKNGFDFNLHFWKLLVQHKLPATTSFIVKDELSYLLIYPVFISGLLGIIGMLPFNPHEKTMQALQKGIHPDQIKEVDEKHLTKALRELRDQDHNGTVLGVSKLSGKYVVIPDKDINQVVLVLGTTGGGKTITLRRFYQRAICKGYPLIIVDGKPDETNIQWLKELTEKYNKPFFGFNCDNNCHYDPLAHGGFTELKDKIVCLKDEWSSDYYKSIAEDYLQTTFEVLLKANIDLDLNAVVDCLIYKNLVALVKSTNDAELMKHVERLKNYEMKDITGLQAHLNILIYSELGQFFNKDNSTFSLTDVIEQNGVVYFALPALRFPSFSKVLGKLVINDIKAVADRHIRDQPIFTVFDEFSVFAGEQVLNLVNMGRGKGIHAIFGTQGVSDLDRVDVNFKNQILNCANTLICHRLNDQDSAETISNWIGTKDAFTITAQLNSNKADAGLGTVKRNREFIVHPDQIKQKLMTGEAYYVTKVNKFSCQNIIVKY